MRMFKRYILATSIMVLLVVGMSTSANASTVIFDNGTTDYQNSFGGRNCTEFICADDVIFAENTTITGAAFYGGIGGIESLAGAQALIGNPGAFTYFIYSDNGTGPGVTLDSGDGINKDISNTAVSAPFFSKPAVVSFDFDTPFQALANTKYWFGFTDGLFEFDLAGSRRTWWWNSAW